MKSKRLWDITSLRSICICGNYVYYYKCRTDINRTILRNGEGTKWVDNQINFHEVKGKWDFSIYLRKR